MRTLRVDNSTLSAVRRCATLAATRYHLGLTTGDESAPMRAGTGVHAAIAAYWAKGDVDAARAALVESYQAWAEEHVSPEDRLAFGNVAKIVQRWCWAHPLDQLPFTVDPALVEVGAQALLTPEGCCLCTHDEAAHRLPSDACTACQCETFTAVVFTGRLDCVPQGRDGRWYVGDVKTTWQIKAAWLKSFELASQFTGYTWLLWQTLKVLPAGAMVFAVELDVLPSSTRTCRTHKQPYAECSTHHARFADPVTLRTPGQLAEWQRTALGLTRRYLAIQALVPEVSAIAAVPMEGAWIEACAHCELFPWCKAERTPDMAAAILHHEPWVPFPEPATEATP